MHKLGEEGDKVKSFLAADTENAKYIKKACASENGWVTMQFGDGDDSTDRLVEVFLNGNLTTEYTLESIRKRAQVSNEEAAATDTSTLMNQYYPADADPSE